MKKCYKCKKKTSQDELEEVDDLEEKFSENAKIYEIYSDYLSDISSSEEYFHDNDYLDYQGDVNICKKCFYRIKRDAKLIYYEKRLDWHEKHGSNSSIIAGLKTRIKNLEKRKKH